MANAIALFSQGTNGTTLNQIQNGLHLNGCERPVIAEQFNEFYNSIQRSAGEAELLIANRIYVQHGYQLKNDFKEVAVNKFGSGVESVNFATSNETAEIINQFVEHKTKRTIKSFVQANQFDSHDRIFLVNAIYLKSQWRYVFPKDTYFIHFFSNGAENMLVESLHMQQALFNYGFVKDLDAAALEMDYANSNFSFLIILPNNRTGLTALEDKLKDYDLAKVFNEMGLKKVDVCIPKFKVETEINLNNILQNVGIERNKINF